MDGTVAPLFRAIPDRTGLDAAGWSTGGRPARLEGRVFSRSARCLCQERFPVGKLPGSEIKTAMTSRVTPNLKDLTAVARLVKRDVRIIRS